MTRPEENQFTARGLLHGGEHRPTRAEMTEMWRQTDAEFPEFTREERRLSRLLGRNDFLLGSGSTYPDDAPPHGLWLYASNRAVWQVTLSRVPGALNAVTGKWVTK